MKNTSLLALTTAALLAVGPALAGPCPNKGNCDSKEGTDEAVYEVVERDGERAEGDRRERRERGDRADRERGERGEKGERRGRRGPGPMLKALGLSEDQQAEAKAIMESAREAAMALREEVKAQRENGEDVDREAIMAKMRELQQGAMKQIYDEVLTDEQRAKADEIRAKMEERRAEREAERGERGEGKEGERPRRRRGDGDGERPERRRGGDDDLDL